MNFRPELAQAVMDGRKLVTRRVASDNPRSPWWRGGCALKPGHHYAVCPGRGKVAIGRVMIENVTLGELGYLSPAAARLEGFDTPAEFEAVIVDLHGAYDPTVEVWRVQFRRLDQLEVGA